MICSFDQQELRTYSQQLSFGLNRAAFQRSASLPGRLGGAGRPVSLAAAPGGLSLDHRQASRREEMADFMTRVVLIEGSDEDYAKLDEAMIGFHFAKTMRSAVGVGYDLPRGSYFSQSFSMTAADVRNLALVATRVFTGRVDILTTAGETAFFLHPTTVK